MYTLTVINQKGGVGKSTTAHNLGAGLVSRGYDVLFIDLDSQTNLSDILDKAEEAGGDKSALNVLEKPECIRDNIVHCKGSFLLPGTPRLAIVDKLIDGIGKESRLKEALALVSNDYDFCIIDTPPALGVVTLNALTASDGAIIPAQADLFSVKGIARLEQTITSIKRYTNPRLTILGVVLTRYNPRAILSQDIREVLTNTAKRMSTKVYQTHIRECMAIKEAQAMHESIFTYKPKSNGSVDYGAFIDEVLKDLEER